MTRSADTLTETIPAAVMASIASHGEAEAVVEPDRRVTYGELGEAIGQVAVVGVPDERMGEIPVAYVVPRPDRPVDADAIVAWARERLSNYKVPRHGVAVAELPMGATGKVLKDRLRARAVEELECSPGSRRRGALSEGARLVHEPGASESRPGPPVREGTVPWDDCHEGRESTSMSATSMSATSMNATSMSAEELIRTAQERTGLDEFDSDSFREPLELIVAEIGARPERDTIANALREEMTGALANRLRVADHLRRHPEQGDAPLDVPIIVMGMPRTGTTLLSYLLDCDPRWPSLLNWEAVDSVPPPTTATLRADPRCVAKKELQEKILPNIPFAVPHWEWADGPTECIFVQAQDFKALSWEARLASRAYADYLFDCDMSSAYDYQKKVMRVLQSQAPGRWALKMPSHALHFEWALEAFPDARFIWTHRNPYEALASLGTTISMGHRVALGHVDEEFIREVYPRQIAEHANRPMRLRPSLPEDKILDVYCAEFLKDPIVGMARIYAWLGEDLPPEVEQAMRAWMESDNERQAGRPRYSLEDFGWTEEEVAPHFAEYLEAYPKVREA